MTHPVERVPGGLLLFNFVPPYAETVLDHARAFRRYSQFPIFEVNTADGFPPALDRFGFDFIVLHYSLFGGTPYLLTPPYLEYLRRSGAYTVAFFQDEYYFCKQRFDFLNEFDIDSVFTLLELAPAQEVYGKRTGVRRLVSTIPGFASDAMVRAADRNALPADRRPVDLGYRARRLPYYMGRGAQEKHEIGELASVKLADSGLVLDIATDEASRLYGESWHRFLGRCRAVLGVEAGVSVFDIDDVVRESCEGLLAAEPELTFEEVHDRVLRPWEGNIPYRTISPRHFEAAAFRCVQVLYEGSYSGILEPYRHYVPLRKDWSNVDDVISVLREPGERERITAAAHADLIASGRHSYAQFVAEFDGVLRESGATAPARGSWEQSVERRLAARPLADRIRKFGRRSARRVRRAIRAT